jgi:2-polyprenyl-3-methyl-5-hydroxy-6-metoxy-1,4-benzoquinol methylase
MDEERLQQQEPVAAPRNEPSPPQGGSPRKVNEVARWVSEAEFFDKIAEPAIGKVRPLEPAVIERYTRRRLNPVFDKEYRLQLLGDLSGQRVLDVGCGDGTNAVLLALRGARVTGVDVSSRSIELAREQARANNVEVELICSPLEAAALPQGAFDVIWGDGILHHVIEELERVLELCLRWARPEARLIFSEPVNLVPPLRQLRKLLPIHTDASPGERPLEAEEIEIVRRYIPDLRMRHFSFLGRTTRFLLPGGSYERASQVRRALVDLLVGADYRMLADPRLAPLGGMCVMDGTAGPHD